METRYRITETIDKKIFRDGMVLFRNSVAYASVPVWSFFVGRNEKDVLENCKQRGYKVEKKNAND